MARFSGGVEDPRVTRTRRDVIAAAASTLLEQGRVEVTHAHVAKRSGYSKATIYAHWPTPFDLARDAILHICDDAVPIRITGTLTEDLAAALRHLATTLVEGHYDRLMAGLVARGKEDVQARELRDRLYDNATAGMRKVLTGHFSDQEAASMVPLLAGAVLVRAVYENKPVTDDFLVDVIRRTTGASAPSPGSR